MESGTKNRSGIFMLQSEITQIDNIHPNQHPEPVQMTFCHLNVADKNLIGK